MANGSVGGLPPLGRIGYLQLTELRCDALPVVHTFFSGSDCTWFLLGALECIPLGNPNSTPSVW